MSEDLESLVFERRELQEALSEAQTIIDQQQDQLTEFRRRAESRTDAEAFKVSCPIHPESHLYLQPST
ncbi:hypothetical protein FGIG_10455 [Fasciola gigantica]|uniref:Uncharacterized protein n=1 Tax=Fasciola gigantica TaxID=46835 RepID=A0A504YKY3_FASGI|nr:hypothetical protein FGIG_10455 [Fasciola gigantica]